MPIALGLSVRKSNMGKRSNFERVARDRYDTPYDAVVPLLYHLPDDTEFIEPCAGKNALVNHLQMKGHHCISASDVSPRETGIQTCCVFEKSFHQYGIVITNPPLNRKILHPLIEKYSLRQNQLGYYLTQTSATPSKYQTLYLLTASSGSKAVNIREKIIMLGIKLNQRNACIVSRKGFQQSKNI